MNDRKFNGTCDTCGRPMYAEGCTAGYGRDDLGRRHCFACCGEHDVAYMRRHGRNTMYLSGRPFLGLKSDPGPYRITNWPGSLVIRPAEVRRSDSYAFGRRIGRFDVWFRFDGTVWHGVNRGDSQILRCKRTKAKG